MLARVGAAEDMPGATEDSSEELVGLLKRYPNVTVDWACSYFMRPRCPAGKEKMAITCYGSVLGCSLNHISFGDVRREPLQRIWQRMMRFSWFKPGADRCLAAFDDRYRADFMAPIAKLRCSPVFYRDHPQITTVTEPGLFSRD
jgi:MoaA/NifB/PqqE/SkfB family radical SAM enzyme